MKRAKALSVTVPYDLADKMAEIGNKEGRSVSAIVSEAVAAYCVKKEIEEVRKDFSARSLKIGVVTEDDIERVTHEYRKERKKAKNNR
jgi:predicted transcriptional regulator